MAINPYDWKKIDPSTVENGFTISFGTEFKIVKFTKNYFVVRAEFGALNKMYMAQGASVTEVETLIQ